MTINKGLFTSSDDTWATPRKFFDDMSQLYGPFDLDAAASASNAKCAKYFTEQDDALHQRWHEHGKKVWLNPPYGRTIGLWIQKAYAEAEAGCTVVMLLAARTDTSWFHIYCKQGEITFLRGRLKFGTARNSAPFPSMVVVFRPPQTKQRIKKNAEKSINSTAASDAGASRSHSKSRAPHAQRSDKRSAKAVSRKLPKGKSK